MNGTKNYSFVPRIGDTLLYKPFHDSKDNVAYYLYYDKERIMNLCTGKTLSHNVYGDCWSVVVRL